MRYKPQINLLYMFTLGGEIGYPVYYKQYLGSTPDVSAFSDIGVNAIEEIVSIGESKNISYKDLAQTLVKIKSGKIDGKWGVYPIKKSVKKLCEKMQFNPNELAALGL